MISQTTKYYNRLVDTGGHIIITVALVGLGFLGYLTFFFDPKSDTILDPKHPYAIQEQYLDEFTARKDVYLYYCPTESMRTTAGCNKIFEWMMQATVGGNSFPFDDSNPVDSNKSTP